MKINKILIGIIFLVVLSVLVYNSYEKYTNAADDNGYYDSCGNYLFFDCDKARDCKSCTAIFGCNWCASGKCVLESASNSLCPSESKASDPSGCSVIMLTTDASGYSSTNTKNIHTKGGYSSDNNSTNDTDLYSKSREQILNDICGNYLGEDKNSLGGYDADNNYISGAPTQPEVYGQCSTANSCASCLSTPDCFWCSNQKQCVSNNEVYSQCSNDTIQNSISQCILKPSLNKNVEFNSDSIIPIVGLSRNTDGSLTNASLKIIIDSLNARGNKVTDEESKSELMDLIQKEINFYKNNYKSTISSYVSNSIDYVSDDKSLSQAKDIDTHIQDLKDVSRYINSQNKSTFMEGFQQDYNTLDTLLNNGTEKNKVAQIYMQLFLVANLVVLGAIFFI